ncbi:MAG: 4-(cytidine 5'-diphospho)-2-C-methyl-D-erythritol kinase, partial [Candidatus Eremiobacteraeota bacterium]|nr:4-(cytidine 5'-diphospho)-2-C-methyl-D-erythritol kinase [Candidatus Eremiobacteraeota bacterium]
EALLPNGYHQLDTIFNWLELADLVVVEKANRLELVMEGEVGGLDIPQDESNLAVRAVRALEQLVGRPLPVKLWLRKLLPAGGGLGGGSADAAAVLWGMDRLFELGLGLAGLSPLASALGADVSFGLVGGTARGRGIGDVLEPLTSPGPLPVLLLCPPFGCPTPAVYRLWDEFEPRPARGASQRLAQALTTGPLDLADFLGNDLEPAAERLRPELTGLRRAMLEAGCRQAMVSGSGSTLFGLLPVGEDPEAVARKLRAHGQVLVTHLSAATRAKHEFS